MGVLLCPLVKNSYARHFKGKHGKLNISLERLIKVDFGKNELPVVLILQKKIAKMTMKMTMCHSIRQMN